MGKKKGKRKRSKSSGAGSNDVTQKGPKPPKRPSTSIEKEPTSQQEPRKKKRGLSDDSRAAEKRSNAATKEKGVNRSRNDLWDDNRNDHGDNPNDNDGNPFRRTLDSFLSTLTQDERESFFSDAHVPPERRAQLWMQQAEIGEDLVNRYSWAVPDTACLNILSHFSPIVEVGCGANAYWCRQMKHAGIDVVGYDVAPTKGGRISSDNDDDNDETRPTDGFVVKKGGPEVLSQHKDRTLFLCYPDENDATPDDNDGKEENNMSLGEACLQQFEGEYVIHVGELYGDTLSAAQAPWGRSSSPMFQQQLAAEYHCVLKLPLSNGWLHVRDSLSVWKRSKLCSIVFAPEEDDDDVEEEVQYRHVPVEERLPQSVAAPCLAHLLPDSAVTETTTQKIVETPYLTADSRNDDCGADVKSGANDKSSSPTSAEKLSTEALEDAEQTKEMEAQNEKETEIHNVVVAPKQKGKKKKSRKKKSKTQDTAVEPAGDYECPW